MLEYTFNSDTLFLFPSHFITMYPSLLDVCLIGYYVGYRKTSMIYCQSIFVSLNSIRAEQMPDSFFRNKNQDFLCLQPGNNIRPGYILTSVYSSPIKRIVKVQAPVQKGREFRKAQVTATTRRHGRFTEFVKQVLPPLSTVSFRSSKSRHLSRTGCFGRCFERNLI